MLLALLQSVVDNLPIRCSHVEFTPGQLRGLAGLSKETFRHWKRVLPALSTGRKHAPCFSAGDVLATTVLHRITESCGARIGHLRGVASGIFDICNRTPWDVLAKRILVVDLSVDRCMTVAESKDIPVYDAVVICSLESRIKVLESRLLRSSPSSVHEPPAPDTADRRSGDAQEQT